MNHIDIKLGEDPLELLGRCDGYYERTHGGPLVGYAATYGEEKKQYVGMEYANFAKAERHGNVLRFIAQRLLHKFRHIETQGDGFCAAPEGGKALAVALAVACGKYYIFPEKEKVKDKTDTSREKSVLVWKRHEPQAGEKLWIVEDTCNNFSTTEEMILLINSRGASVLGIVCFLNRSLTVDTVFTLAPGLDYPVNALVRQPIAEYRQDDPAVVADVIAGNVVWKPKDEWYKLVRPLGQL